MKRKLLSILYALPMLVLLPTPAHAACQTGKGWILNGVHTGTCGGTFDDFLRIITNIIAVLLNFGFVVAVIWLIWGGINYIMSRGRPDLIDKSYQTIKYAIVGLVIVMLARFIIYGINSFVLTSGMR